MPSARAISNIKFDKVVVWDGGGTNGEGSATAGWLGNMARSLPPMMQVMKDLGGVELPETFVSIRDDKAEDDKPAETTEKAAKD